MQSKKRIFYVYDKDTVKACSKIPNIKNRSHYVHSLVFSYNLQQKVSLIPTEPVGEETIRSFHTSEYVELLKKTDNCDDLEKLEYVEDTDEFNLGYDCPLFTGIFHFVKIICGGTMAAAKQLTGNRKMMNNFVSKTNVTNPKSYLKSKVVRNVRSEDIPICNDIKDEAPVSVAINWNGGWHHAQADSAEGFCYVNDIVIAILYLNKYFTRILYIDLDIHHGNGVENAFSSSSRVLTWSIHKHDVGYYPCSGEVEDVGLGNGQYYTVNCPLKDGASDETFSKVFNSVLDKILTKFAADCIVLQGGGDCLAGDPLGGFNLTNVGLGECVKRIINLDLPTLVLGGGGYNIVNTAKYWTYLTALITGESISTDIPESYQFFNDCGPEFELQVTSTLRKDTNTSEYIQQLINKVYDHLNHLPDC